MKNWKIPVMYKSSQESLNTIQQLWKKPLLNLIHFLACTGASHSDTTSLLAR